MTVIKISNKKNIDDLRAKLILRLGRKVTFQETLDLCVLYASRNIEDILALASSVLALSPEMAEDIIESFEKFKGTPYNKNRRLPKLEDKEIYQL